MRLICPKDEGETEKEFGRLLLADDVRQVLDEACKRRNSGVRRIDGGRFEVSLTEGLRVIQQLVDRAAGRGCTFWEKWGDGEAGKLVAFLISRAEMQALQDDRASSGETRKFHNFSVIVTYGTSSAQVPHVDLVEPNFQYGMTLHDNTPSTITYCVPQSMETTSASSLVSALTNMHGGEAFPNWQNAKASNTATDIMSQYGNVLAVYLYEIAETSRGLLPAATLMSLGGGVPHAGPSSAASRAIIFFSSCDTSQNETEEYDRDIQFNAATLLYHVVGEMWADLVNGERKWFLGHLLNVSIGMAQHYGKGCVLNHIQHRDCPGYELLSSVLENCGSYAEKGVTRMAAVVEEIADVQIDQYFFFTKKEKTEAKRQEAKRAKERAAEQAKEQAAERRRSRCRRRAAEKCGASMKRSNKTCGQTF
jgi:hypothetical protein